jgi:CIC family chloride channel protein
MKGPFVPRYVRFLYKRVNRFLTQHVPNQNAFLLALAFGVGIGSGLGAIVFEWVIDFFRREYGREAWVSSLGESHASLQQALVLLAGGLAGGLLTTTIARSSRGHGVPDIMARVAIKGGRIPPRVAGDTALSAGVCIASGGSAGPEGPIVQIGSSIGSTIGQITGVSTERLRVLTACGAAGGISAIFGAPLAGVMFAVEVILGDFGVQTLTPIVISSVLAAVTHQIFVAWRPRFSVPPHGMIHFHDVAGIIVLGVLAAVVSWLFTRILYWTEDRFRGWNFPRVLKPAVGMLVVGAIAFAFPRVLGAGYEDISDALHGRIPLLIMGALVLAKVVATCFTVGTGNVGGLFAPCLVVGAMLGGAFGGATEHWLDPGNTGLVTIYALVGMGAMIAGTTRATITAILLIFELTNDYAIVLPTMLAVATTVILSAKFERESIYTLKLVRMGIHLKRGVEVNVMGALKVEDVMKEVGKTIPHHLHFARLLDLIEAADESTFPVIGDTGELVGVLSYQDIRTVLSKRQDPEMDMLLVAGDIATADPVVVTRGQSLNDAMRLFGVRDLSMLPVVDERERTRLVGVLHRRDVLIAYRRALMEKQMPASLRA